MDNLQNVRLECLKLAQASGTPVIAEVIARAKEYEKYVAQEDAKESMKEVVSKTASSGKKQSAGNLLS